MKEPGGNKRRKVVFCATGKMEIRMRCWLAVMEEEDTGSALLS